MPTRPRVSAALTAGACVAALATALAAAPAASAHSPRGPVAVHTTSHRTVVAPSHVHPGTARLHNSGRHAVIVISGPAHHAAQLAAATKRSGPGALKHFSLRGEIAPHRSIYLRLTHGTLYLVDMTRERVPTSAIRTVHVTGTTRNTVIPGAASLTVRPGPGVSASPSFTRGSLVHVNNASKGTQYFDFMRIGSHTSDAQLAAYAAHPSFDKLADLDVVDIPDFVLLSAHRSEWAHLTLAAGRYVVVTENVERTPKVGAATFTVT